MPYSASKVLWALVELVCFLAILGAVVVGVVAAVKHYQSIAATPRPTPFAAVSCPHCGQPITVRLGKPEGFRPGSGPSAEEGER